MTQLMATKFTKARQKALEHLAAPAPDIRPELQRYSDWELERTSGWRFIPGIAWRTREWLVQEGYAERHPSLYYAYRITDRGLTNLLEHPHQNTTSSPMV